MVEARSERRDASAFAARQRLALRDDIPSGLVAAPLLGDGEHEDRVPAVVAAQRPAEFARRGEILDVVEPARALLDI